MLPKLRQNLKLPNLQTLNKKTILIIGIVTALLIAVAYYVYMRHGDPKVKNVNPANEEYNSSNEHPDR